MSGERAAVRGDCGGSSIAERPEEVIRQWKSKMSLDFGTALMMMLRWFVEVTAILGLIALFSVVFDFIRDWIIVRLGND